MNPLDNDNPQATQHPLLIPKVVSALFQAPQLTTEDLKNCRLVCKLWVELSLPRWRNTAVVALRNSTYLEPEEREDYLRFVRCLKSATENPGANTNPTDLQLVKLDENPFSKYVLHQLSIVTGNVQERGEPWSILAQQHVKYLHLETCQFASVQVTSPTPAQHSETLMERLWQMPQLEELVLSDNELITCSALFEGLAPPHPNVKIFRVNGVQVEWINALQQFPMLELVEIKRCPSAEFAAAVTYLGPLVKSLRLKSIDVMDSIPGVNINWMKELYYLTSLAVGLPSVLSESQVIGGFTALFLMNRRLKILKIQRPRDVLPFAEFPDGVPMKSLEVLELWGNVTSSLQFLRFSRNLKKLVVNFNCFEKWREDLPPTDEILRLTSVKLFNGDMVETANTSCGSDSLTDSQFTALELLEMDCQLGVRSLITLSKWAPNLKTLRTIFNNFGFRTACQRWPRLRELVCLYGSTVDERGGLLSIRNLTELYSFRFESACNDAMLTDLSVHQGFMKMDRLQKLQICVSPEMSPEAESLLKQRITFLEVVRNYGMGHQSNSTFFNCCKRKRYDEG